MSDLLLATDTSGKNGRIALARVTSGQSDVEIVGAAPLAGGAFSAQLVPQIAALLENHGYRKSDLAAFAVVSGPGRLRGCAWLGCHQSPGRGIAETNRCDFIAGSGC